MRIVRVCGPAAKTIRAVADVINGPDVDAPKAIMLAGVALVISDEPLTARNVRHEQQHIVQARRMEPTWIPAWGPLRWLREAMGWRRFYTAYAVQHFEHGYWDNPFEVEARAVAGEEST